jgi:hypothetical protein
MQPMDSFHLEHHLAEQQAQFAAGKNQKLRVRI